jgi:hypothetical protein
MMKFTCLQHENSAKAMRHGLKAFFDFYGAKHLTPELADIAKQLQAATDQAQAVLLELDGLIGEEKRLFGDFDIQKLKVAAHRKAGGLMADINREQNQFSSDRSRYENLRLNYTNAGLSDEQIANMPDAVRPNEAEHKAKIAELRNQLETCEQFMVSQWDYDLDGLSGVIDFETALMPPLKVTASHIPYPTNFR